MIEMDESGSQGISLYLSLSLLVCLRVFVPVLVSRYVQMDVPGGPEWVRVKTLRLGNALCQSSVPHGVSDTNV